MNMKDTKTGSAWLLLLLTVVFLVLAPMFFGQLGVFFDDYYETFTRLSFEARTVKAGSLPLWDPHTFAGGRINWIPNTRIWYWPLYPFYLLSPAGSVDASYFWLVELPLLLHWLLAGGGAWLLGRGALKLRPEGAFALGLVYALGAGMTYNICDPNTTYAVAWVPWAIWGIDFLARKGAGFPGAAAAAAVAFIGTCGSDVRGIFSLGTIAIFTALLAAISAASRDWRYARRLCLAGAGVFLLGFLISAPYWLGMRETARIYRDSPLLEGSWAASPMFSMPWRHLITVLIPDAFGTLTCSAGVNLGFPDLQEYLHLEGNLTGGYLLALLIVLGSASGFSGRAGDTSGEKIRKRWWWASLVLVLLSWFMVTGSYSAFYLILVRMIPPCGLPYALRWRILGHLGMAVLAGISVHWLFASSRSLARRSAGVLALLTLGLVLSQALYVPAGGVAVWRRAWDFHWAWVLSSPLPSLALVIISTILVLVFSARPGLKRLLLACLVLETALQGFLVIYYLSWAEVPEWIKYKKPSETAYYRLTDPGTPPPAPEEVNPRTAYHFSFLDQTATLHGGDYLFGHCSKPLLPRLRDVAEELTSGYPYALRIQGPSARFYPNMSVEKILLPGDSPEKLEVFRPPGVLPRVYTQDRLVRASAEEARAELLGGDLREAVFIEDSEQVAVISDQLSVISALAPDNGLRITDYDSWQKEGNPQARFEQLQRRNRILGLRRPAPTELEVEIAAEVPAVLVATDVFHPDWEVRVDGELVPALQVNYLQRGVWLERGKHLVQWRFRPAGVRLGLILAGLGGISALGLALAGRRRPGS